MFFLQPVYRPLIFTAEPLNNVNKEFDTCKPKSHNPEIY